MNTDYSNQYKKNLNAKSKIWTNHDSFLWSFAVLGKNKKIA